jgi:hypothetical protein
MVIYTISRAGNLDGRINEDRISGIEAIMGSAGATETKQKISKTSATLLSSNARSSRNRELVHDTYLERKTRNEHEGTLGSNNTSVHALLYIGLCKTRYSYSWNSTIFSTKHPAENFSHRSVELKH